MPACGAVRRHRTGTAFTDRSGHFDPAFADTVSYGNSVTIDTVTFGAPDPSTQFAFLRHFWWQAHLCDVRLEESVASGDLFAEGCIQLRLSVSNCTRIQQIGSRDTGFDACFTRDRFALLCWPSGCSDGTAGPERTHAGAASVAHSCQPRPGSSEIVRCLRRPRARLFAARGEYQSFQIAIPSPPSGFQLVDAICSDLTGAQDLRIASGNVRLYREHYVNVDAASPDRHGTNRSLGPGLYPDALIPFRNPKTGKPLAVSIPGRSLSCGWLSILALWVDVFVPLGTPAGQYHASITLTSDRGKMEVPWSLNVWGFDIPVKPSLHSSFAFWNTVGRDAVEELLRHRLMPQHIAASPSASLDRALASADGLTMTDAGFWSGADNSHCTMKPPPAERKDLLATVAAIDPGTGC